VVKTTHERENFWSKWCGYDKEFEDVNPYVANEYFEENFRLGKATTV